MLINGKPIEIIDAIDIRRHQEERIAEDRFVEYKLQLPKKGDDKASIEFCLDISAFANASGGYIIYGIKDEEGVPVEIPGLPEVDFDAEIRRLDDIHRSRIDPRLPAIRFQRVDMPGSAPVLVVGVERSWRLPHMVEGRVYSRVANRKHLMDMTELRSAVLMGEGLQTGLRQWRMERLSCIKDNRDIPIVRRGGKVVLHIVPLAALNPGAQIDLHRIRTQSRLLAPIHGGGTAEFNFDGLVTISESSRSTSSDGHLQLFRDGRLEVVDTQMMASPEYGPKGLACVQYERDLIESIGRFKDLFTQLGSTWPLLVMMSFVDSHDHTILGVRYRPAKPFGRTILPFPDIIWNDAGENIPRLLRPLFDMVWNSAGFDRSLNYDDRGHWSGG